VVLRHTRRRAGRDNGKAGDGAAAITLPNIILRRGLERVWITEARAAVRPVPPRQTQAIQTNLDELLRHLDIRICTLRS
jgi:hypothetical protein